MLAQPRDRIAERPGGRFVGGAIGARIVRRAVAFAAIGEMLDQSRTVVRAGAIRSPLCSGIDRQRIIAVDAQARDAITHRTRRKGRAFTAGKAREAGDRPLVVHNVEDDGCVINGRKGQRRMEVALGRRALTAPDGRDAAVALRRRSHRPAHRLRILRRKVARHAEETMLGRRIHDRQLAAEQMIAAVRIDLVHHLDQRIVARDQDALLAIARENHIGPVDRHRRRDRGRLFAGTLHIEAGLALPLRAEHAVIERARQHHVSQHRAQPFGRQLRIPLSLRVAVEIEHADKAIAQLAHRIRLGRFARARGRFDRGNFDIAKVRGIAGAIARFGDMKRQRGQIARRALRRLRHIFFPLRRESAPSYIST